MTESTRLSNVSARGHLGAYDEALIGGFVIEGASPTTVLVRGIGPALSAWGVEDALPNPTLTVLDHEGNVVGQNDDWESSLAPVFSEVGAFDLPAGSLDAAVLLELPPGVYTATIEDGEGVRGEALFELYEVINYRP